VFSWFANFSEEIVVDTENPFNNGSVSVFPLLGIKSNNGLEDHQGYAIVLPMDKRGLIRDKVTEIGASILNDNTVVIYGIPSESNALLCHGVETLSTISLGGTLGDFEYLIDGVQNGLNEFLSEENRFFKRKRNIKLIFPKSVQLSVACFKNLKDHGRNDFDTALPFKTILLSNAPRDGDDDTDDKSYKGATYHMFFTVARVDIKTYKRNKGLQTQATQSSKAHQSFGL
jgi:hypothetical protein